MNNNNNNANMNTTGMSAQNSMASFTAAPSRDSDALYIGELQWVSQMFALLHRFGMYSNHRCILSLFSFVMLCACSPCFLL